VLVASLTLGGGRGADAPPVVASAASPKASAEPEPLPTTAKPVSEPITVTLRAYPPRAVLYYDDGPALPNPYQLVVLPDPNAQHQVRASAPGFADHAEELRLDGSKEVRLTLSALAPGAAAARVPNVKPKSSAEVTHTGTQAPPSGDLPKIVTKRPRVLDPDNPFAAP
jgi:hypothetical protein